jgi:hypothetical protein
VWKLNCKVCATVSIVSITYLTVLAQYVDRTLAVSY